MKPFKIKMFGGPGACGRGVVRECAKPVGDTDAGRPG